MSVQKIIENKLNEAIRSGELQKSHRELVEFFKAIKNECDVKKQESESQKLREEVEFLKEKNRALVNNLLTTEDPNHYFKLMSELRDKLHELEVEIRELRKSRP